MQKNSHKKDLRKKFLNWFKGLWPILVILLAVLVFFYPVWLKGLVPLPADFVVGVYFPWLDYKWGYAVGVPVKNPMTTDVVSFIYPMQMLAIDSLKSGQWPLWNPYILMGTPLLANFQSAPFSPTNIVYFIFDRLTAWSIQIMLQHALAAVFTYFLLRYWKVSRISSLAGGLIFGFSGFNLLWSQWNGHALTAAFIPLLLLLQERWLKDGRVWSGAGISIVLSAQIFSGYPQVVFYTLGAMGILWLFRLKWQKEYLVRSALLGIFSVVGLGLAAPQILPGKELLNLSQREIEPHPAEWAFLPFVKTITFIAPDFFGNHATKNWWGPQDYTSNTGFVGGAALIFATLCLFILKKNKEALFAFILLIVSLLFAYPTPFSIFVWESGFLGLQAASAHRMLVLFNLSVSFLAAFGMDYFVGSAKRKDVARAFLLPGTIIGSFGIWALVMFWLSSNNPEAYPPLLRGIPIYTTAVKNMIFPTGIFLLSCLVLFFATEKSKFVKHAGVVTVVFLMCFELFRFGWKFTPFSPRHIVFPKTPILNFLTVQEKPFRVTGSHVIPINMRMPYKLETPEGYDAVYPLNISKFLVAVNRGAGGAGENRRYAIIDNETSPLLDLLNTKYYLGIKKDTDGIPSATGKVPKNFDPARFKIAFEDKSVAVLESNSSLPRAFMVYDWEVVKSENQMDQLLDKNFPISSKILLEENAAVFPAKEKGKFRVEYKQSLTSYKKYTESESLLGVITDKPGLLFISETFYPGWKAYIDDKETRIYRANYAFRAVSVPEGNHEVRFVYSPDSFFNGVKISILSALALALFALVNILLGKRRLKSYT